MRLIKLIAVILLMNTMIFPVATSADANVMPNQDENEKDVESGNVIEELTEIEGENTENLKDSEGTQVEVELDNSAEENSEVKSNEVNIEEESKDYISGNDDDKEPKQTDKDETNMEFENKEIMKSKSLSNTPQTINIQENKTSRLGHLNSSSVRIYKDVAKQSEFTQAGSSNTNEVYYIKLETVYNNNTYYLISRNSSSTVGVLGWVKSTDMETYEHKKIDGNSKTMFIKGSGSAYTKAWGGRKNYSFEKLSSLKDQVFTVNLTESVGKSVWYRGTINGKTAWIHEANVYEAKAAKETKTSRLGHLNSSSVRIYKDVAKQSEFTQAGSTNTNEVYYIKLETVYNNSTYYLISRNSSSTVGVLGWVKSTDMETYAHKKIDDNRKTLFIQGSGSAYTKAWGGRKNFSYQNLTALAGQKFNVNLTESVGNSIWYRGTINGKTAWIQESNVSVLPVSRTSRLGHLNSGSVRIYKNVAKQSEYTLAGSTNTNEVYYIKQQTNFNNNTYYLISRNPSSTKGVVGWVKSTDMQTHEHKTIDAKPKTMLIKGSGSAYTKAWGGRKNFSYQNLSTLKDQVFTVNLTESVGKGVWYRGAINGKTAWIHESNLYTTSESRTSRLGHIKNGRVLIYKKYYNQNDYIQAGSLYTNAVYYIKQQAIYKSELYYLISQNPSSNSGVVGWVKATDLDTQPHVGVDKIAKTYYFTGGGAAYTKAWGGSKNINIANLDSLKGQTFQINLTEKVGNNIWYRGTLNGKTAWVHHSNISINPLKFIEKTYTEYNLTLSKMSTIQGIATPQTDKRYPLWIREDAFVNGSISNGQGIVKDGANWNLRRGPGTHENPYRTVSGGTKLTIYASTRGTDNPNYTWYHVSNTSGWVTPDKADLTYYINPDNFTSFRDSLQFLKLSHSANIDVAEVNEKVLKGKGILEGQAQAFVDAGKAHGINEIYLISHALLETGNGNSTLAKGVIYNGKTVYNMFGTGAYDTCPIDCGAKYAYDAGWFTPELAIIGGTKFIADRYVKQGRNTLYKMRWDPAFASVNGRFGTQYATDIGWAVKQTARMNELYGLLDTYIITLDIPIYK